MVTAILGAVSALGGIFAGSQANAGKNKDRLIVSTPTFKDFTNNTPFLIVIGLLIALIVALALIKKQK